MGVEIGGWLVSQHQGGPMNDGAGNRDALAFAAGKQVGTVIGAGAEANTFERGGHAGFALAGARRPGSAAETRRFPRR